MILSRPKVMTAGFAIAFLACIVGANWAINRYGLVSVGFGLVAPAGVYFAGLTFGLRDAIQERGGRRYVLALILVGSVISLMISDSARIPTGHTTIAIASGLAFLFSETCDFMVYTPLRERHLVWAVVISNVVGAFVDSALFLWLAFGSLTYVTGNVLGKLWMTLPALLIVWMIRRP